MRPGEQEVQGVLTNSQATGWQTAPEASGDDRVPGCGAVRAARSGSARRLERAGRGGTHEIPDPTDSTTPTGCHYYTWTTQPKLVIHLGEFESGGGSDSIEDLMKGEVQKVVDQFNAVGGTSAKVTKVETSYAPFSFDKYKSDGAIHLGFTSQANFDALVAASDLPEEADALTQTQQPYGCGITEAHILFPGVDAQHWTFYTPFTASWYAAGRAITTPARRSPRAASTGSARRSCTSCCTRSGSSTPRPSTRS